MRPTFIAGAIALAAPLFCAPAGAAESTKQQCTRAAERAQQSRLDGKLLSAKTDLHICLRSACPAVIRSHCTRWFEEVDAALPSVVVRVRDEAGLDLADARVTVDGAPLENWKSGMPISLDPGEHAFQYSREGSAPQSARVLLGTGEKNRVLAVTLAAASRGAPVAVPLADGNHGATAPEPDHAGHGPSAATWVAAGAAVVAFGGFAYFGATGHSELGHLRDTCGATAVGGCRQVDVDAAWSKLVIADVSLGVGILATGVATWLFFATRGSKPSEPTTASTFRVVPSLRGAGVVWDARF